MHDWRRKNGANRDPRQFCLFQAKWLFADRRLHHLAIKPEIHIRNRIIQLNSAALFSLSLRGLILLTVTRLWAFLPALEHTLEQPSYFYINYKLLT